MSDESTIFFFYLWLSCRYLWKVLVPCSSLRRDSREREREREGCAENVYIYSWYGVGLKWGYREEKGFCFVYLGSGHECWVSVSDYELWLILGVTRISNRWIDLISDHLPSFYASMSAKCWLLGDALLFCYYQWVIEIGWPFALEARPTVQTPNYF